MSDDDTGRDFASRVGATKTTVRSGGRALASFAALVALVALGLAGYPYYQRFVVGVPPAANTGEFEALRMAQQRQTDELTRLAAESAALDARLKQQQSPVDAETAAAPPESIAAPTAMPDRALKIAEAAFLLQGANDRLLVTHDTRAALAMLRAAQSLIDQIDDAALTDVRAALTNEIASLRDVAALDIEAILARLEALLKALPELPARGAQFVSPTGSVPSDTTAVPATTLAWQKFLSLFEFHRQSATARPPLGPDEATYLRLNLGLMLQTAQLALLRHDDVVYQKSLESVRRWLDDYLDTNAPEVAAARSEIDQLLAVRVDRALPDVGGSLVALRRLMAQASAEASVAPANPSEAP